MTKTNPEWCRRNRERIERYGEAFRMSIILKRNAIESNKKVRTLEKLVGMKPSKPIEMARVSDISDVQLAILEKMLHLTRETKERVEEVKKRGGNATLLKELMDRIEHETSTWREICKC